MASSTGILGVVERRLVPLANTIGKNKYLVTLRDTFVGIMPLLIVGSVFTLINNFPIQAWTDFLKATAVGEQTLSDIIAVPANCTVAMMAIFVAFLLGYNFAEHEQLEDRVAAGVTSLLSWLVLMPLYTLYTPEGATETVRVASIPLDWIGAKGVFVAMVFGFVSVKIYGVLVHKDITIKMPEGVPPTVSRSFSALIPMAVAIMAIWIIRVLLVMSPWDNAFNLIYSCLQVPLQNLGGTVFAQAGVYLFAHILWFFGIHGTNITGSIYEPILLSLSAENQQALAMGEAAPNIINYQFQALFATIGGAGCALSLIIAMLLFCKSDRIKSLARLCIGPGIFNINEPIIFGLPIVLNPVLLVPFVACPLIYIVSTYAVMAAGIVPVANAVLVPWTTPPIISGFLVCGWQGALWQAFLMCVGVIIYLPFIKVLDRQYLAEEQRAAEGGAGASAGGIDDIDLDAIDFDDL